MYWRGVPPLAALGVGLAGVTVPSFWRDESVSAAAARMPWDRLWRLLGSMDAVHGLYYLLLRPLVAVFGVGEVVLRLPSVLAMAATAYGVCRIGERLAALRVGIVAGLAYALLPIVSRYGQEARSYALVSAVAVLATWLLLDLVEGGGWRVCLAYGGSLALLGWLHLYALLLVPSHLATVLWRPSDSGSARGLWPGSGSAPVRRWAVAVAGAVVAVLPLALVAVHEQRQVAWLRTPGVMRLAGFAYRVGGSWVAVVFLGGLGLAGVVVAARSERALLRVALPWAVLPVALSFAISQVHPVYSPRYVLFCVPGFALLLGAVAGVAVPGGRWRWAAPAALVLLAVLVLPAQVALRRPDSRPDNLRAMAGTLAAQERPGDGVLFVPRPFRLFVGVYEAPLRVLHDITYARGPFLRQADRLRRIWMVSPPHRHWAGDRRCQELLHDPLFRVATSETIGRIRLTLFTHT
ncbi:glycosyltransferase family 39 protein [Nonomuraea sp. NPDC050536]|uniref:glycosyltransferase family 39 protein n=1 Tax=Nonomuraea sp. NPDC050536 TaxID=3364366 RepID=UPI0037CC8A30